jgi:diadenosine tetraphosphate (Ap4A) HIT family hydrolase
VRALRRGRFAVFPRLEPPPVPGWLVLAPLRHVEQWDALDETERREIGPLVAEVAAALRAETPTARVYVSAFGEVLPHFHVHVVARPPELPAEMHGPRVFLAEGGATDRECAELARRVYARLGRGQPPRPPWAPALLSGLLWPGLGQMRNGRWVKGLLFALLTVVVLVQLVWRVLDAATQAVLTSSGPLGPSEIWGLAEEIQRRNAGRLSGLTLLLLLIWAASVGDAWWDARRPTPGR